MSNDRSDTPGTNSQQDRNGKCFVIAPIGSDGSSTRERTENLFNHVIQPIVEEDLGFKVIVAHKIDKPGNITRQVMELLFEAELVIADLTEHNPNVMYELAVRHATGKPVVTIAQEGIKPPFDIGPQRTKFYKNTLGGVQDFKPKLKAAVKATLKDEYQPDNPIYRVRADFQMREAVAGDDAMEYVMDRLDSIETALTNQTNRVFDQHTAFPPPSVVRYSVEGDDRLVENFKAVFSDLFDRLNEPRIYSWKFSRLEQGAQITINCESGYEEDARNLIKQTADQVGADTFELRPDSDLPKPNRKN